MRGDKFYYKDGITSSKYTGVEILHREDGPAIEYASGYKAWYINGERHREDGPAIEWASGNKGWYLNDLQIFTLTKEYLIKYMELNNLTVAYLLTDDDKMIRTSAAKYKWNK